MMVNAAVDRGITYVFSAGNSGPGINSIGDPSVATDVMSVASSITKETWKSNYGADVSSDVALHNYSSRGPREDGGFKPNVTAPGSAISTTPKRRCPGVKDSVYPGSEGATTVRTLLEYSWAREHDGTVAATVVADAFCHSMVRALVGSVVPVGTLPNP